MRSPILSPRQFDWALLAFVMAISGHWLWLPIWYSGGLATLVLAAILLRDGWRGVKGVAAPAGNIRFPLIVALSFYLPFQLFLLVVQLIHLVPYLPCLLLEKLS